MILKILLLILIIPVIIVVIAVGIHNIPLPASIEDSRDLIGALAGGIISLLYLFFLIFYTIHSFKKLGRIFDEALEDKGLRKQEFRYFGRCYEGTWEGRKIRIEYFPPKVIQGALLNIYLSGNLNINAAISKRQPILDNKKYKKIDVDLEYGFNVYAADNDTKSKIFSDNDFLRMLNDIIKKGRQGHILQIYFQGGRVYLRSRSSSITPEGLKTIIKSLAALAEIIENK